MQTAIIFRAFTLFLLIIGCTSSSDSEAEKAAIKSAESWLALIDSAQYGQSWEEAAEYFKGAMTREMWEQTMESMRKPLGNIISRELKSKSYRTALPGAPDGEYVVIRFKASFENKISAIETITPMLDKDGKWRVSGYYLN